MTLSESHEARLKRLKIRAWRRGTKEMDLVLGNYADHNLGKMSETELQAFEALMEENDQDLMSWLMGQVPAPQVHHELLAILERFAEIQFANNR